MAWTSRTFPCRGHTEAKAGENFGQGKPSEDVIKNAIRTNQQEQISGVLLTRSPSSLVGALTLLLPRVCSTCVHGSRLSNNCTWRERVLSLEHRRCNKPEQNHCAQQSPHENDWLPGDENVHTRTSGDEGGNVILAIILRKWAYIL